MKDILGQELAVGDLVAFNPPRYKGLTLGTIVKFSPKMVTVEYNLHYGPSDTTSQYPTDMMKASEEQAIMYYLKKKPAKSTT